MIAADVAELVVIDDDHDLRMLTTITFQLQGWRVESAPNGHDGLRVLREMVAMRTTPAVLLDVQMPDIDGWEVLGLIRADPVLQDLPVLLCTVRAGDADRDRGFALGADGFVAKPFDVDDLVEQVRLVSIMTPTERRAVRAQRLGDLRGPLES